MQLQTTELKPVDRRDPTPLHHQVRRGLLRHLRAAGLKPGDQLPPEPSLCQAFSVSRHTLRQAVDSLVKDGMLARRRPWGTFVDFGAVAGNLRVHRSIWEDLRRLELKPEARLVSVQVVAAKGEVARMLDLEPGTASIRLERVFLADGEPLGIVVSSFAHERFTWLLAEDLTQSWYELAAARGLSAPERARQIVRATIADEYHAGHLGCPIGFPLLETLTQVIGHGGEVINYSQSRFRADRYHFSIDLPHRPSNPNPLQGEI